MNTTEKKAQIRARIALNAFNAFKREENLDIWWQCVIEEFIELAELDELTPGWYGIGARYCELRTDLGSAYSAINYLMGEVLPSSVIPKISTEYFRRYNN